MNSQDIEAQVQIPLLLFSNTNNDKNITDVVVVATTNTANVTCVDGGGGGGNNEVGSSAIQASTIANEYNDDSDILPTIIRNMKWKDPVYENSNANEEDPSKIVIAAFDLNRNIYNRSWCEMFFILVGIVVLVPLLFFFLLDEHERRTKLYRIQHQHIGMTKSCIYIDLVETPRSTNVILRNTIHLNDISKVRIQSKVYYCLNMMLHTIQLVKKNGTIVSIEGIRNPQMFFDTVIAMIRYNNRTIIASNPDSSSTDDILFPTTSTENLKTIGVPYATAVV